MSNGGLRFLSLSARTWDDLTSSHTPKPFKHVVGPTAFTRTWREALVLVQSRVIGAVVVRRYGRPGYEQDGLEFLAAEALPTGCEWSALVAAVPVALHSFLDREDGEPLPPKTGQVVEASLDRLAPGSGLVLAQIRQLLPGPTSLGHQAALVREQRDAIALGLEIAGIDSHQLRRSPSEEHSVDEGGIPFLQAWNQRRTSEAATIRHDFTAFDEWLPQHAGRFDTATFQDPEDAARRVTVFYADKELLEQQTGTDLLYYRHHRPGFILVQYKRMRASERAGVPPTYYPDDQLRRELSRYRQLPLAAQPSSVEDWRLTEDAFFVKLVRDDVKKPRENKLVRGMYLPIGLVDLLLQESEDGRRPKGWSTESTTTYLSNGEFLRLAKQGYVGTRGATTGHLIELIRGSLHDGRGVVLTVDETDPNRARRIRHG